MKLSISVTISSLLFAGALHLVGEGAIEGTVSLPKSPVGGQTLPRYQNKIQGTVAPPSPPVAVVYLEGKFAKTASTNISAKVIQEHFQFLPAILPVQVGTTV